MTPLLSVAVKRIVDESALDLAKDAAVPKRKATFPKSAPLASTQVDSEASAATDR